MNMKRKKVIIAITTHTSFLLFLLALFLKIPDVLTLIQEEKYLIISIILLYIASNLSLINISKK